MFLDSITQSPVGLAVLSNSHKMPFNPKVLGKITVENALIIRRYFFINHGFPNNTPNRFLPLFSALRSRITLSHSCKAILIGLYELTPGKTP